MTAIEVKLRRGTNIQHANFVGAPAELTAETTNWGLRLHDGITPGGKTIGEHAQTAQKLATARNIAGVAFDGTANIALTSNNIVEADNLYFTNARTRSAISASGSLDYNATTGVLAYQEPVASTAMAGIVRLTDTVDSSSTTTAATPNAVRQAYERAVAAVDDTKQALSASGSLTYNATTGVFGYEEPIASTDIAGIVSLTDAVDSTSTTTAATPNSVRLSYELAASAVADTKDALSASGSLQYNSATGVFNYDEPVASTSTAGIVRLNDAVDSTSTTTAATANAVRQSYELAASAVTSAKQALSASGSLTYDPATGVFDYEEPVASTTNAGIVSLTNAVDSTSTTTAATPNSVRQAYELAAASVTSAKQSLSASGSLHYESATGVFNYEEPIASTATAGIVRLTDAVDSSSTTTAATPNSVRQSYELAAAALPASAQAVSAQTADRWTTSRNISLTGDVSAAPTAWNGSTNIAMATTLANSGVSAGSYSRVSVDAKGRVTAGYNPAITGVADQIVVTAGEAPVIGLAENATVPGTSAIMLPIGTIAQRPPSPTHGMQRYNTTLNQFEFFQASQWIPYVPGLGGGGAARASISSNIPAMSGSAVIPFVSTEPTITQGAELFTMTLYPYSTLSRFTISVNFTVDCDSNQRRLAAALFRNSTCISVVAMTTSQSGKLSIFSILVTDNPGTTSPVTYSLRFGGETTMTWYVNSSSTGLFGGKLAGNGWQIAELT